MQVVATRASRHFYTQQQVDDEVAAGPRPNDPNGSEVEQQLHESENGVRVWVDEDEWSVSSPAW